MKRYTKLFLFYMTLVSSHIYAQVEPINFTVLHTNDHHGHFWTNAEGEYGMAARQTLFKRIRKEVTDAGGFVLTLSGGDINSGTMESDMWLAKPDIYGMNMLGYDAMVLGNHEFDRTLELTLQQASWANFPFLSANIYSKATGERIFQPYHIFERAGLRVAVVGLTTEESQSIASPHVRQLAEFRHPIADAQKVVNALRSQDRADVVIGLTHMGFFHNGMTDEIDSQLQVGDIRLAQALPTGAFDAIIGGHSHSKVCMLAQQHHASIQETSNCLPEKVNGTWIMQANEWGKYVGRADFQFANGKLTLMRYQLIDVNLKQAKTPRITPDPDVKAFLMPYYEAANAATGDVVALIAQDLQGERSLIRHQQAALGALIADAVSHELDLDFSIINSGSIRDSLASGRVTRKDILRVLPFNNKLVKIETQGSVLLHYLEHVAKIRAGVGAFPQFYGITFLHQFPLSSDQVFIQGEPLDLNRTYRFGMTDFMAYGGDAYPSVIQDEAYKVEVKELYQRDALENFFRAHPDLALQPYFEYANQSLISRLAYQ